MFYNQVLLTKAIQHIFTSKRRKARYTQEKLSAKSNVSRQFISLVESGKRSPSVFTAGALAGACKMTLTELFQEVDRLYHLFILEEECYNLEPVQKEDYSKSYEHHTKTPGTPRSSDYNP